MVLIACQSSDSSSSIRSVKAEAFNKTFKSPRESFIRIKMTHLAEEAYFFLLLM